MSSRLLAVQILAEILKQKITVPQAMAQESIAKKLDNLSLADKAFCYNLFMLVLRHYDKLIGFVNVLADKKPRFKKYDKSILVLLLGLVQILFLRTPLYAVQSESKKMLTRPSELANRKFIHAMLQKGENSQDEFGKHRSISAWEETWQKRYGVEQAESLWSAIYDIPPLDLQFKNESMREEFAKIFDGEVIESTGFSMRVRSNLSVEALPFYKQGQWWVQDKAAILAVELLGVQQGSRILDLCAAPGGKTVQLINKGACVVAVDRSKARIALMEENLYRLGMSCEIICSDGLAYESEQGFESILLDAPCSGSGTLRHNPELPLIKSTEILGDFSDTQLALLSHSYDELLQGGGRIIYSVCSLQEEEGESVIEKFLSSHSTAEVVPLSAELARATPCHISDGAYMRTFPSDLSDSGRLDGFFMAVIRKP